MTQTPVGPPESLAAFRLPSTDALAGSRFDLDWAEPFLEDGGLSLTVEDGKVTWEATAVSWAGKGHDDADVVEAAPGTYFIDIDVAEPALDSLTVVLNPATGWALAVHQRRFHPEDTWSRGPEVSQEFLVAKLSDAAPQGEAPALTRDLIGRRHLYRYSPNNLYEHVYLNSRKFCGHNVHTFGTPGRADCHPVTYYRFDEDVYVIGWREYDSAVAMVSVLDLKAKRATAKAHAPEHFLRSVNRPIGGHITEVTASMTYPDDLQPA